MSHNPVVAKTDHELGEQDIQCLGNLRKALLLLDKLQDVGCERDVAGNRKLFFNDYCKLVLLYTWNPLIGSIRDLQKVVGLSSVAKALGVERFSLGSFSESCRVFEPDLLKGVIAELGVELRQLPQDPRLADLEHALTLVDGTVLEALPRLTRAICDDTLVNKKRGGGELHAFRLHMQLDLRTFLPFKLQRTGASNAGELRESAVLRHSLEAGRCYVNDGAFADGPLMDEIVEVGSSFVTRVRENCAYEVIKECELTPEARSAGIISDRVVRLGGNPMKHPVRLLTLAVAPHPRRTRKADRPHEGATDKAYKGQRISDRLMIATNLIDLPSDLTALIYSKRYGIELYFRFLKQLLGMRHLLSRREEGVEIQIYCAVIVCLLINLMTGKKPNRAMVSMIGFYLAGMASVEEVLGFLNKPDNTGVKKRAKDELWKKLGY